MHSNMLKLVKDSPLKKLYMEAREDALAEDIKGTDLSTFLLHHCQLCAVPFLKRLGTVPLNVNLYDLGIDFRGGLLLLPSIFKEKIEDFIILGQVNTWCPA